MKNSLPLLLLLCLAMPASGQSASAIGSNETAVAGVLIWVAQALWAIVAVLGALAWIWSPFMVKRRLDQIIRKLDNIKQS